MPRGSITPMLTVRDAAAAIEFYKRAFAAREQSRLTTPTGQIVAEMSLANERFFVVDEIPEAFNVSPETLSGTSVRLSLIVADADLRRRRPLQRASSRSSRSPTSPMD